MSATPSETDRPGCDDQQRAALASSRAEPLQASVENGGSTIDSDTASAAVGGGQLASQDEADANLTTTFTDAFAEPEPPPPPVATEPAAEPAVEPVEMAAKLAVEPAAPAPASYVRQPKPWEKKKPGTPVSSEISRPAAPSPEPAPAVQPWEKKKATKPWEKKKPGTPPGPAPSVTPQSGLGATEPPVATATGPRQGAPAPWKKDKGKKPWEKKRNAS